MCECVHPDCLGLIAIKLSDYETARSTHGQFLVKAGHDVFDDERILARTDGHQIVTKLREDVVSTAARSSTNGHGSDAARAAS